MCAAKSGCPRPFYFFLGGFEAGRLKSRDIKMFEAHFEPGQGLKEAPVRVLKAT